MSDRKTIFVIAHHGKFNRDLFQSGFLNILRSANLKIVLLSPVWRESGEYVYQEYAAEDVILEKLHEQTVMHRDDIIDAAISYIPGKLELLLKAFRDGVFTGVTPTDILRDKYPKLKTLMPLSANKLARYATFMTGHYLGILGKIVSPQARGFRNLLGRVDAAMLTGKSYNELFEKYQPSLIFSAFSPWETVVIPILREARQAKVPSIVLIQSWDNLSGKGDIAVRVDKLIVWNEVMKQEAIELHDYRPEDVYISGAPPFDMHFRRKNNPSTREEFFHSIGADPQRKLLTMTLNTLEKGEHELDIAEILAQYIVEDKFAFPCQLLVRARKDPQLRRKYEKFEHLDNIFVDYPLEHFSVKPSTESYFRLSDTLLYSDVVINTASTITLEACIFDTPVVNIGFDGYAGKPYRESVARFYNDRYYHNIVTTGGFRIAYNKEELLKHINDYLQNSSLDSDGRKRIVEEQCYYQEETSRERVAHSILNYINKVG